MCAMKKKKKKQMMIHDQVVNGSRYGEGLLRVVARLAFWTRLAALAEAVTRTYAVDNRPGKGNGDSSVGRPSAHCPGRPCRPHRELRTDCAPAHQPADNQWGEVEDGRQRTPVGPRLRGRDLGWGAQPD